MRTSYTICISCSYDKTFTNCSRKCILICLCPRSHSCPFAIYVFFFNILAIIAGAVAVVLALLSFDITKVKILAMIVSIVGLAISIVIAGFLLFSAARLSWSVQNAFNNSYNYDYNYGDSFWDDDDDFWD